MPFAVLSNDNDSGAGREFFRQLTKLLLEERELQADSRKICLANVSAPVACLIIKKIQGYNITLRLDGLYYYSYSKQFCSMLERHLGVHDLRSLNVFGYFFLLLDCCLNLRKNYRLFLKIILANRIIYQSAFSKSLFINYPGFAFFWTGMPSIIIPNGSRLRNEKEAVPGPNWPVRLASVASARRGNKGTREFLEICCELAADPKFRLSEVVLVGDILNGPQAGKMARLCRSLRSRGVRVTSTGQFKSFDAVCTDYALRDCIVIWLSRLDPCPNLFIEFLSAGCPAIFVDSGGNREIIGDAGYRIDLNDHNNLGYFCNLSLFSQNGNVDRAKVLVGVDHIMADFRGFSARSLERVRSEMSLEKVAFRYKQFLIT